jgi:exopolysaccharide biosynthesis protein
MEFRKTEPEKAGPGGVCEVSGATDDGVPFQAFLMQTPIPETGVRFRYSEKPMTVSEFVADSNAFAGINGGFYVLKTGRPLDWTIIDGKVISEPVAPERPCIFSENGRASIGSSNEHCTGTDVMQAGPLLLGKGVVRTDFEDYVVNARQFDCDITAHRFPRTIFGIGEKDYFLLVVDGRSKVSAGLFLHECAELGIELGMKDAVNLDGGGSSALVANGRLFNNPRATPEQVTPEQRAVPTALLAFRVC